MEEADYTVLRLDGDPAAVGVSDVGDVAPVESPVLRHAVDRWVSELGLQMIGDGTFKGRASLLRRPPRPLTRSCHDLPSQYCFHAFDNRDSGSHCSSTGRGRPLCRSSAMI